eukprot:761042-Hanusia_phi.AAC.2
MDLSTPPASVFCPLSALSALHRASMVQFISGFSIGADAQSSLEKIANLSSNAQTVLPTSISEIFERIDRPTSYQNIEVAAQGYEHFGTGLDVSQRDTGMVWD